MAIKFNDFNNSYERYNFAIGKNLSKEAKARETQEVEKEVNYQAFKGLKDETDLLTKNSANLYGIKLGKFTLEDKDVADKTNEILASLGYEYKVSAAQVASVTNGMNVVVMPGMKLAENAAVEAHIQDPNGPFAELFTKS